MVVRSFVGNFSGRPARGKPMITALLQLASRGRTPRACVPRTTTQAPAAAKSSRFHTHGRTRTDVQYATKQQPTWLACGLVLLVHFALWGGSNGALTPVRSIEIQLVAAHVPVSPLFDADGCQPGSVASVPLCVNRDAWYHGRGVGVGEDASDTAGTGTQVGNQPTVP